MTLSSAVDWDADDQVFIASSDFDPARMESDIALSPTAVAREMDVVEHDDPAVAAPLASDHFGGVEGLGDIVIRPKFQPGHPVLNLCAAGNDDDHRSLFQRKAVDKGQPVGIGQRQVHKADIGRDPAQGRFEFAGAGKGLGAKTRFGQCLGQHPADFGLVVEDRHQRVGHAAASRDSMAARSARSNGFCSTGTRAVAL